MRIDVDANASIADSIIERTDAAATNRNFPGTSSNLYGDTVRAQGGCFYTLGSLMLSNTSVIGCSVTCGQPGAAEGGAFFVAGSGQLLLTRGAFADDSAADSGRTFFIESGLAQYASPCGRALANERAPEPTSRPAHARTCGHLLACVCMRASLLDSPQTKSVGLRRTLTKACIPSSWSQVRPTRAHRALGCGRQVRSVPATL